MSGLFEAHTDPNGVMFSLRAEILLAFSKLAPEEKHAYNNAASSNPSLVTTESDPLWFYSVAGNDKTKAAKKLATYWAMRTSTFGARALRPLTLLTGEGALNSEEMSLVDKSVVTLLSTSRTGSRKPVLYIDGSKAALLESDSHQRCLFYVLQTASTMATLEPLSQNEVTLVIDLEDVQDNEAFDTLVSVVLYLTEAVFPMTPTFVNVLCQKRRASHEDLVTNTVKKILETFPSIRIETRFGTTAQSRAFGQETDAAATKSTSVANTATSRPLRSPVPAKKAKKQKRLCAKRKSVFTQECPVRGESETLEEFLRRRNAFYSRRKYKKKKIEFEVMNIRAQKLSDEHAALQAEHERLTALTSEAKGIVALYEAAMNGANVGPSFIPAQSHRSGDLSAASKPNVSPSQDQYRKMDISELLREHQQAPSANWGATVGGGLNSPSLSAVISTLRSTASLSGQQSMLGSYGQQQIRPHGSFTVTQVPFAGHDLMNSLHALQILEEETALRNQVLQSLQRAARDQSLNNQGPSIYHSPSMLRPFDGNSLDDEYANHLQLWSLFHVPGR